MILIKTETGNELINEKEFIMVSHDRNLKTVKLYKDPRLPYIEIDNIESITYTNEAQPTEWKVDGSRVEYLNKMVKNLESRLTYQYKISDRFKEALRRFGTELENFVNVHHEEIPSELSKNLSDRGVEAKDVANSEEGWVFSEYAKNLQQGEQMEADEVARLNGIINDLHSRLYEVAKDKEKYQAICQRHLDAMERIMSRNLIERIINKKPNLMI